MTTETSLAEMNTLAEEIATLRDEEKAASDAKHEITARLEAKEDKMLESLMANDIRSYKAPAGTVSIGFRTSAKLPQGDDRKAFYDHLKAIGKFDIMISVSSQVYNAYVKEQFDLAKERGEGEPTIPGVSEVKMTPRLSFRKTR